MNEAVAAASFRSATALIIATRQAGSAALSSPDRRAAPAWSVGFFCKVRRAHSRTRASLSFRSLATAGTHSARPMCWSIRSIQTRARTGASGPTFAARAFERAAAWASLPGRPTRCVIVSRVPWAPSRLPMSSAPMSGRREATTAA